MPEPLSPYPHALAVAGIVHQRLLRWTRELMERSGVPGVDVLSRPPAAAVDRPTVVVWPYRLGPWPKLVEPPADLPLLVAGADRDPQGVVPDPWLKVGKAMLVALQRVYPMAQARPGQAPRPQGLPRLDALPAPLQAWYGAQGAPDLDGSWVTLMDGVPFARVPSLAWRRGIGMRVHYLALAFDGAGSPEAASAPFSLGATVVMQLGIQLDRVLQIDVPPRGSDVGVAGFMRALGEAVGGEEGETLGRLATQVEAPAPQAISVQPVPELEDEAIAQAMRTFGRELQPSVHFMVHLTVGGAAEMSPMATFTPALTAGAR